jgi:ABC-type antimicrobial peptide transport system permease subunit
MAIGARAHEVARHVAGEIFALVLVGAFTGLVLGAVTVQRIQALLYQVKPTDPRMLIIPALIIVAAALVAALPAVNRAVRIDPATTLRDE